MNKKLLMFLFLFVLISSLVFAVPPFADQTNSGDLGLQIEFPAFESGKVSTAFEFPFHVFNISNGLAMNESINCTLHVYNEVGDHIFIGYDDVPSHVYDYEFALNDSLFSSTGVYRFVIYCEHNAGIGGFVEHGFEITTTGYATQNDSAGLLVILILIPLIFGLFMLIGGATMGDDHSVLRIILFLLSVPMVWISLHWSLIGVIRYYGLTELQDAIGSTTYWMGWFFFVLISYFVIYMIWKAIEQSAQEKDARLKY